MTAQMSDIVKQNGNDSSYSSETSALQKIVCKTSDIDSYEIPMEFKCCRCHLDLRINEDRGGCKCIRTHENHSGQKLKARIEYDDYDGYGYSDYAKYLRDHLDDLLTDPTLHVP